MNRGALLAALLAAAAPAFAQTPTPEQIEVTATRTPEAVLSVPASVTIIPGQELRDRNATTLAAALALVAGVEAPPGGDCGARPARCQACSACMSSTPSCSSSTACRGAARSIPPSQLSISPTSPASRC